MKLITLVAAAALGTAQSQDTDWVVVSESDQSIHAVERMELMGDEIVTVWSVTLYKDPEPHVSGRDTEYILMRHRFDCDRMTALITDATFYFTDGTNHSADLDPNDVRNIPPGTTGAATAKRSCQRDFEGLTSFPTVKALQEAWEAVRPD
ncbi:surface-adhesin E family protein [Brevundimonas sp.]|uniref:surface-adhesin E family protein n=1 Tax=Brevundimonas sp. TaxID=1871086 RepID=UPI0035B17389